MLNDSIINERFDKTDLMLVITTVLIISTQLSQQEFVRLFQERKNINNTNQQWISFYLV